VSKTLVIVLTVVIVVFGFGYFLRANNSHSEDPTNGDAFALSVPVIVTPSLQIASGQVILYKMTNLSEGNTSFRLMLYNDDSGVPTSYKDYTKVGAGKTVSYVYRPPTATLALDEESVEAPQPVRATLAPIPATDDPGVIRRVVANVQIMRIQKGPNGASLLDTPIVVPLSHCNFEPRSLIPYLGGHWYWNCAPDLYPVKPLENPSR
jgi:hypothetical protein